MPSFLEVTKMRSLIVVLAVLLAIPMAQGLTFLGPEAGFQSRGDIQAGGKFLHAIYNGIGAKTTGNTAADAYFCTGNFTAGNVTYTLTPKAGAVFFITCAGNPGSNYLILDPVSSATIDGAATLKTTDQYSGVTVMSDGTNFFTVGKTGTWA
jgi:hypothetical protein